MQLRQSSLVCEGLDEQLLILLIQAKLECQDRAPLLHFHVLFGVFIIFTVTNRNAEVTDYYVKHNI